MFKSICVVCLFYFVLLLNLSCTEKRESPTTGKNVLSRGINLDNVRVNNAWNAPTVIDEWTSTDPFGGSISLTTSASDEAFLTWENRSLSTNFVKRSGVSLPWESTGPIITGDNSFIYPVLHNNPISNNVYATWYNMSEPFNANFISRYSPSSGWSTPLGYSSMPWSSKIITDKDGNGAILWLSHAENGTSELYLRLVDSNGNLGLVDTLILGEPGKATFGVNNLRGAIKTNGDIQLFWVSEDFNISMVGPFESNIQIWTSTFSKNGTNKASWSEPTGLLTNSILVGYLNGFEIINKNNDDYLIIFNTGSPVAGSGSIYSLESNNGVWGELIKNPTKSPFDSLLSKSSFNTKGEVVFAWSEPRGTELTPGVSAYALRVFMFKYDFVNGWSSPIEISNSTPIEANGISYGSGDEPKIKINEAGQIAVAWINPIENNGNIYTNFYDPITGWLGEELAVSNPIKKENLQQFELMISNSGDVTVVWRESVFGAGGTFSNSLKYVDHVGAGNGVVNLLSSNQPSPTISNGLNPAALPKRITANQQNIQPMTQAQHINSIVAAKNASPIRLSSAWDEPTIIGTLTSPADVGRWVDVLDFEALDSGDAIVKFMTESMTSGINLTPVNHLWLGNVISGGWIADSPLPTSNTNNIFVNDIATNPVNGDLFISWFEICDPATPCQNNFVARKPSGLPWEPAVQIGTNSESAVMFAVNANKVIASWVENIDVNNNDIQIAYSEFDPANGWSTADIFTTTAPLGSPGAVSTLSHGGSFPLKPILSENGVYSILTSTFNSPPGSALFLIQRHPVNGWTQMDLPPPVRSGEHSSIFLSPLGVDSDVLITFDEGFSSVTARLVSYQFVNGVWSEEVEVSSPKLGDFMTFGIEQSPKDNNSKGQVLVAWNELIQQQFPGSRQVRVNWFDPNTGWGTPTEIGYPMPASMPMFPGPFFFNGVDFMRVSINESGQGAVSWVDSTGPEHMLNVVHLDSTMTSIEHEIMVTTDPFIAAFDAMDLNVDSSGRATLIWDEMTIGDTELTHVIKTSTHHANGSISPTPVIPPELPTPFNPVAPDPTPGWSAEEVVINFSDNRNFSDYYHSGIISANATDTLVSVQVDSGFDNVTKKFSVSEFNIMIQSADGIWRSQNPFVDFTPDVSNEIQIVSDSTTNTTYVLWVSQQQLYLNHKSNTGTWGIPRLISSNTESGYVFANATGDVVVVWQLSSEPNTIFVSEVAVGLNGELDITAGNPSMNAATTLAGTPVLSHAGTVAVLRTVPAAVGIEYVVTQYKMGIGWLPWPLQTLNTEGFDVSTMQLAITSDDQIVVFAESNTSRKLQSAFLLVDETWSNWIPVQSSDSFPTALSGMFRFGTSNNGHLYISWVEEMIDSTGQPKHNVMFSALDKLGISAGNAWTTPTLLTQIRHPNYSETPLLLVKGDGSAAVVWQQAVIPSESYAIVVKKFHPQTGWVTEPEVAAGFTFMDGGEPSRVNATLSEFGQIFIVWQSFNNPRGATLSISMVRGNL